MPMSGIAFQPQEEDRYDRQRLIEWWDQERLSGARVIVAGAGALGNEVLKLLALLGVGHILVVDFDMIAASNLARMVLFRDADIGRPKVEVAVERVRELNPQVEIRGVSGDLRFDLGLGEYRRADLVFGCLDSVNARWALNRKCLQAGVPWIDGGISDFHGQVTRYSPDSGACYECTFTQATYERFDRRYSCPYGLLTRAADSKVPTTAITSSLIAALQVQEGLLLLHGRQADGLKPGERLNLYVKPYQMTRDLLPANAACLAHDTIPGEIRRIAASPEALTAAEAILAAQADAPGVEALELSFELVEAFVCPDCCRRETVLRPKEKVYQDEARCPTCGGLRLPETLSQISPESPLANLPLSALGVPPREILTFLNGENRVYLEMTL
jgi:adenylyltransferase/sulfurtransferase